jgi:predicted HTH domain antitoxin
MSLFISDEIVQASGLSEQELMLELIILLFQKNNISIGKASQLAQMPLLQFQNELAQRNITIDYDESDLEVDLENLGIMIQDKPLDNIIEEMQVQSQERGLTQEILNEILQNG